MEYPGTGAHESPADERTWQHPTDQAVPLTTGGIHYDSQDHENQHTVGICTAISLVQNAEKATGKKDSPDFQYLLQKKFFDGNWIEGSSIFSALKTAKNFGLLPLDKFTDQNGRTYVTEADRELPYQEYIAKLQAIPEAEITRLLTLCERPIIGYAQLKTDPQSLAKGINDSKAGILTRFVIDQNWWVPSWNKSDIDPLRAPNTSGISGHAITESYFNLTDNLMFELANSWGPTWDDNGNGHTHYNDYHCTEAWIPYYETVPENVIKPQQAQQLSQALSGLSRILLVIKSFINKK